MYKFEQSIFGKSQPASHPLLSVSGVIFAESPAKPGDLREDFTRIGAKLSAHRTQVPDVSTNRSLADSKFLG
jgi:hypothetical protein